VEAALIHTRDGVRIEAREPPAGCSGSCGNVAVSPGRPTTTERDAAMSNLDRLRDEGLITQDLPAAHQRVIEELDPEHIDVLIEIKEKLEAADEEMGLKGAPAFTKYLPY
jgi:hypothetical protein